MLIHWEGKTVQTKIVYFGPAMSGKTTSLRALFKLMNKDGNLKSIETTTGRTLFFDFGTLDFTGVEWTIKIFLYSTTGQDFYQSTRPAILYGVDGIIFIVDSQRGLLQYNKNSWEELKRFFQGDINEVPVVVCLNKYDLDDKVSEEDIRKALKLTKNDNVTIIPSIATECKGIEESFSIIMTKIFPNFHFPFQKELIETSV